MNIRIRSVGGGGELLVIEFGIFKNLCYIYELIEGFYFWKFDGILWSK